ncbi:TetR/AcrR family transcriptional regulator [Jatrophihabitans lederbergiae]|uniref:TetR/AcrR family transcriptional regulator n=1 Tax=Jatrophihabitans lederbergiae TaxID=3075547 RepID=A0ABU2JHB5_9ACTN|nr:TetR/AcrR family transcriptional regulator [Jatrophihabitans sp. DSM 44399]MDT0264156.1 TetR/AcrR family transcriptional regulator [Jatrophihabitans sp. DSM 44399]
MSRARSAENRAAMVDAASVLVRERGLAGVTIEAVCARVGLTNGGFYKQFTSREALVLEALQHVVEQRRVLMSGLGDPLESTTWQALIDVYLSDEHRDDPGHGCVVAALAGDPELPTSAGFGDELRHGLIDLAATAPGADENPDRGLATVALLVGALQLARMTVGTALSEQILAAARAELTGGRP